MAAIEASEAFLEFTEHTNLRLNRDGTKLVYVAGFVHETKSGEHYTSSLWIADVASEKSARQLTSGKFHDFAPEWSPDGNTIYFLSDRAGAGKKVGLYQLNLGGGEPTPVTSEDLDKPIECFAISPDGKHIAYLSPDENTPEKKKRLEEKDDVNVYGEDWDLNRLRLFHVPTKTTERVDTGNYHIVTLVFSPDSKSIAFASQVTPEMESPDFGDGGDLHLVDVATKKVRHLTRCEYASRHFMGSHGYQWVGDRIYAITNALPGMGKTYEESSNIVTSVSVVDGTYKHELGGDTYCIDDFCAADDRLVTGVVNGLYAEIRDSEKVLFRESCTMAGFSAVKDPKNPSELIVAISKDSVNKPGEVFTFTSSSPTPVQVSDHAPNFSDPAGTEIEVHTRSADGKVLLRGLFVAPKSLCKDGKPSKPLKTLVYVHGGPYHRLVSSFFSYFGFHQSVLRAGYAVFYPDYRGGQGSGSAFASPYRTGEHDLDDVLTMTQATVDQHLADPNDLIITGWSQGGMLTYLAAVRNGLHGHAWRWKGCIAGAGVSHSDTFILTSDTPLSEVAFSGPAPWGLDAKALPNKAGSALWQFKAAADEGRVPPMLLLHGEEDVRVPVTQAWGFYRACKDRGIECQMATYPREGHMVIERKHIMDMHKRVLRFCDTHFSS